MILWGDKGRESEKEFQVHENRNDLLFQTRVAKSSSFAQFLDHSILLPWTIISISPAFSHHFLVISPTKPLKEPLEWMLLFAPTFGPRLEKSPPALTNLWTYLLSFISSKLMEYALLLLLSFIWGTQHIFEKHSRELWASPALWTR